MLMLWLIWLVIDCSCRYWFFAVLMSRFLAEVYLKLPAIPRFSYVFHRGATSLFLPFSKLNPEPCVSFNLGYGEVDFYLAMSILIPISDLTLGLNLHLLFPLPSTIE